MNTPQLQPIFLKWIVDQARAGMSPTEIVDVMVRSGWTLDKATAAVDTALAERMALTPKALQAPTFPFIDLEGAPRELDLGDRTVQVVASLGVPQIVVLAHFLSPEECDALIETARPQMQRSHTVSGSGGMETLDARTSSGTFLARGVNEVVARVEQRLSRLCHWPASRGERLQVLNYPPGAQYKPHYDYFDPNLPSTHPILQRGGQRVGTVLMYLNNTPRGGGTVFPDWGLEVAPNQGHAVFFAYPQAVPESRSLHGGAPVLEGDKWVATQWWRQQDYQ
jgi:prolyl 4-hydroxylase